MEEPGLNKLIRESYKMLSLLTYFTAGEKEVRAWTIREGSTAPKAAGVIHTDFEKGFIRAETTSYSDFIEFNGETGAKEAGKLAESKAWSSSEKICNSAGIFSCRNFLYKSVESSNLTTLSDEP